MSRAYQEPRRRTARPHPTNATVVPGLLGRGNLTGTWLHLAADCTRTTASIR